MSANVSNLTELKNNKKRQASLSRQDENCGKKPKLTIRCVDNQKPLPDDANKENGGELCEAFAFSDYYPQLILAKNLNTKKCEKNPKHTEFVPIKDFSHRKLPHPYNKDDMFDKLVAALGKLVVKITYEGTSPNRPMEYKKFKGNFVGSGNIIFSKTRERSLFSRCPCRDCRKDPVEEWGEIKIRTAAHVVCDDDEASRAECLMYYDSENSDVIKLQGIRVSQMNRQYDTAEIICVTHDVNLAYQLMYMIYDYKDYHTKLYKRYLTEGVNNLVILISHPHGCSKHVTFGKKKQCKVLEKLRSDIYVTKYYYDSHACPGSSGAPVYMLSKESIWISPPHSVAYGKGGQSGAVWENF
ncbi:unnamed protein product [Lymnaea stagnalis]|uniref:Uncharacterized protein n=1 Tax=Lymnaea stagnalis TaxID=6523 RepID=A0AAV2HI11_LYMST